MAGHFCLSSGLAVLPGRSDSAVAPAIGDLLSSFRDVLSWPCWPGWPGWPGVCCWPGDRTRPGVCCWPGDRTRSGSRPGPGARAGGRLGNDSGGTGVGHSDGQRVLFRVGPGLLMRWPGSRHRLASDLQVVDKLRPRPDSRALAGLGRVLNQLVQAGISAAMPVGLNPHGALPALDGPQAPVICAALTSAAQHIIHLARMPRNLLISSCLSGLDPEPVPARSRSRRSGTPWPRAALFDADGHPPGRLTGAARRGPPAAARPGRRSPPRPAHREGRYSGCRWRTSLLAAATGAKAPRDQPPTATRPPPPPVRSRTGIPRGLANQRHPHFSLLRAA